MSLNIYGSNNVINVVSPTTSSAPSRVAQNLGRIEQELNLIGSLLQSQLTDGMDALRSNLTQLQPCAPQAPADPYQAAYTSMDPAKAAKTLLANFNAVEGVGVNDKGDGAGDANIGRRELERVADPNSGFPPDVRAAAKWMLDHPTASRSIDQGASKASGDANEYHFSKADLQAFVASTPESSTPAQPSGLGGFGGGLDGGFGGGLGGGLGGLGGGLPSTNLMPFLEGFNAGLEAGAQVYGGMLPEPSLPSLPSLPSFPSFGGPSLGSGSTPSVPSGGGKIDDVYSAAKQVKDYFSFIEGVGMNDSGAGAGDGNIGMSELRRVADPNSGAPEKVRQAAKFLIDHPTALTSLDQAAGADGQRGEVHIGKADVDAFLANAPKQEEPTRATAFLRSIAC